MATELGKAYVQIIPSAKGISGSISSALSGEAESAGKSAGISIAGGIGTALKSATGIVAAGATALTGALVSGSSAVAEYGDNIDKMSQKMGISRQGYQEWEAVMQHSGTSMETMKSSMKTLANAVEKGNGSFERIGISLEDLSSMSQEDIFAATIAGLQNVDNETERTYLAGQLLGKGATELGALLNTSAEDTQAMRDRVRELGGVMSDDAVKAAAQFQDNMQDLKTAISGVGRGLISQLMPSMNTIIEGFTSLIIGEEGAAEKLESGFSSLFTNIDGIAQNLVSGLTTMLPSIINSIASILPQVISMAGSLISSLATSIVGALPTLITTVIPALLQAAVQLVVALGQALIQAAPQLFNAGAELLNMLFDSFSNADTLGQGVNIVENVLNGITSGLPSFLDKGIEIITNIANGILTSLPQLITTAGQLITTFASFLMQNYPTIMQKGAELLLSLVNGIISNLPQIAASVVQVIGSFAATILSNLPTILAQGILIIGKLAAGLIQAIPQIIAAIPQIIKAIIDAFSAFDWASIGKNILEGIKNGILDAVSAVVDAAKEAASAVWDAVKGFFDIGSPSKLMAYAGEMIDTGLANGIAGNQGLVDDAIDSLNDDAMNAFTMSPSFGAIETRQDDRIDELLDLLGNYLPTIASGENMNVSITGDAEGIFNLVKSQNKIYKRMNGESAFA